MSEYPDWLAATLASDAAEGRGVLPNNILPLQPGLSLVAPARVVQIGRDDNLALRNAMDAPPTPGVVLVVAGGDLSRTATIGGLMALELQNGGIAGLVTDGMVRDSQEIRAAGFPVWCRGVTPTAPKKEGPTQAVSSVSIGGILIRNGDLVIADDDGVVIWQQERIAELLAKAAARLEQDNARLERLLERRRG